MSDSLYPVSFAALLASLHSLRVLAQNGLISPSDADVTLDGIMETLEALPEQPLGIVHKSLDPVLVAIKQAALEHYRGSDD